MNPHDTHHHHAGQATDTMTIDPVCGMTVDPEGPLRQEHHGTTYVFCCEHCLEKFRADPDRYVGVRDEGQGADTGV